MIAVFLRTKKNKFILMQRAFYGHYKDCGT